MRDKDTNIKIARKIIKDTTLLFDEAVEEGNWMRAADLQSYISGMEQIMLIFDSEYLWKEE